MKNLFPLELCKVIQATILICPSSLTKKVEEGYAQFLYHVGVSRNDDPIKSGGPVPGGFGQEKGGKGSVPSFLAECPFFFGHGTGN